MVGQLTSYQAYRTARCQNRQFLKQSPNYNSKCSVAIISIND